MNEARAPTDQKIKDEAKKDWQKGMKQKDIAKKYGVSISAVKSWVSRYWKNEKVATKEIKKSQPKDKKPQPKKPKGAPCGNRNAVGSGAPARNKNAEKHGFFTRYLPEDALSIIKEIEEKDPLDILWENIQLSYVAILRAQRIMYVDSKEEMIKEIKKLKTKKVNPESGKASENEVEWEFQFSWDRQASFLTAQAKAMAELRAQIRHYDEMLHANWDIISDEQKARIAKLKAETERIQNANNGKEDELVDDWITSVMGEIPELGEGDES